MTDTRDHGQVGFIQWTFWMGPFSAIKKHGPSLSTHEMEFGAWGCFILQDQDWVVPVWGYYRIGHRLHNFRAVSFYNKPIT